MSTIDASLKYLWVAEYTNGEMFEQPADDRSVNHDPAAEHNKSAFADIDQDRLKRFHLVDQSDKDQDVYTVDLESGQFAINGRAFDAHPQLFVPRQHKLRLIFFREVRQDTTIGLDEAGEESRNTIGYINRYLIGWQCTDEHGKNHEQTIAVR